VTNVLKGIIDFIKNVFTGNWKGAWQSIKDIFSNIVSGLANIFKAPINAIIDGINGFLGGLSKIKIPDWVPGVGGKGFSLPTIPRLKVGMDYVPSDYFPAFLDKGERVLTAEENAVYSSLGGIRGIETALSASNQIVMMIDPALISAAVKDGMDGAAVTVSAKIDNQTTVEMNRKVVGVAVCDTVDQTMSGKIDLKERGAK